MGKAETLKTEMLKFNRSKRSWDRSGSVIDKMRYVPNVMNIPIEQTSRLRRVAARSDDGSVDNTFETVGGPETRKLYNRANAEGGTKQKRQKRSKEASY